MEIKNVGRNLVVKLNGDIDHHISTIVREKIQRQYKILNCGNIVFDMSGVNFMDSSAIGMIIGRYKELKKSGGKVYVVNVNAELEPIIEISGLRKIINFVEDADELR